MLILELSVVVFGIMPEWFTYISGTDPNVLATFELVTLALAQISLALLLVMAGVIIVVYAAFAMVLASFGMCLQAALYLFAQQFAPLNTLMATMMRSLAKIAHIFWDLLMLELPFIVGSRWHH